MRPLSILLARLALAWLGLVPGCSGGGADEPPAFRLGEEACAGCRMIINEQEHAAAIALATGEALKFDDLGCMILFLETDKRPIRRYWVAAHQEGGWLEASRAHYVRSPRIPTPMGYGIVAVATAEAAARLASEQGGETLRFESLSAVVQALNRKPDPPR